MHHTLCSLCPLWFKGLLPQPSAALALVALGLVWATAIGMGAGHLKLRRGLRTNYTRKIFHFGIFSAAMGVHVWGGFPAVNAFAAGVVAVILWGVWRGDGHLLFEGMARERDAPHRAFYVVVPLITTALGGLCSNWLAGDFALVGYLVTGWGDAVGEPVGAWLGRHPYRVPSLIGASSTRSVEGSTAVFLAAWLAAVASLMLLVPQTFAATAMQAVAVAAAAVVIEAASPHGSDNFTVMVGASLTAGLFTTA